MRTLLSLPILSLSFVVLFSGCSKTVKNTYENHGSIPAAPDEKSALASTRNTVTLEELNENLQQFNSTFIDKILSKDDYVATLNTSFHDDLQRFDSPLSDDEADEHVTRMKRRAKRVQYVTSPWETAKRTSDPCKSKSVRWMVLGKENLVEGTSQLVLKADEVAQCNEIVNNAANKPFIDAYQRVILHKAGFKFDVALFVEGYADNFLLESRVSFAQASLGVQENVEISPAQKPLIQLKELVSIYDSIEKAQLAGATIDRDARKITYENVDYENVIKVCEDAEQRLAQLTTDPDNKLVRKIRVELEEFIKDLKIVMKGFLEKAAK